MMAFCRTRTSHRSYTSEREVRDTRRPERHVAVKALVAKMFGFVEHIWKTYVQLNQADLRLDF